MNKECKHDWIRLTNINKMKVWYMVFIYSNEFTQTQKLVCLKCGKEWR